MKLISVVTAAIAASACTPLSERVYGMSDSQLCYGAFRSGAYEYRAELKRRGYKCTQFDVTMQQRQREREDAAYDTFLKGLSPPPEVNCTSNSIGSTTYTNCR